jgi:hypothetical protein
MNEEIWKDIYGYEGLYQVSDLGRVKSFKLEKQIILKQSIDKGGYYIVCLYSNKGKKSLKVHQLVTMSFLNHRPDGTQKIVVDHIDSDKKNNRIINLQLLSSRENTHKSIRCNNKSNNIGVNLLKNGNYESSISIKNKRIHLGTFKTKEEAIEYYKNALKAIENGEEIKHNRKIKSSKYKGVYFVKKETKWTAYMILNKKKKNIGHFKTEQEAYEAREEYIQTITNK